MHNKAFRFSRERLSRTPPLQWGDKQADYKILISTYSVLVHWFYGYVNTSTPRSHLSKRMDHPHSRGTEEGRNITGEKEAIKNTNTI